MMIFAGCLAVLVLAITPCSAGATPSIPPALPPAAPKPTAHANSPAKPDPHPPRGGIGPDGSAVGGPRLLSRGVVLPAGAPKLPKHLTAHAWVLADLDTGAILAARDPHGRYQPASIFKTLTSLVLLPKLPGKRVVTVDARAADAEGSAVGIVAGGKYTVDTLFKSLLLMSGNDAAMALAEAGGGVAKTVAAMNREILALGGYDTLAQTPSGLDGWQQLTSAYDMALVLRAVASTARFIAYDRAATATLPRQKVHGHKYRKVPLFNQSDNFFSTVPGAILAKTGYTDAAQETYLCAARRGGHRLGVIFLRNKRLPLDQYQQAAALLSWGARLPRGSSVGTLAGPISTAPATPPESISTTARPSASAASWTRTQRHSELGLDLPLGGAGVVILVGGAAVFLRRRARH